jgi:hypothetical protein
MLRLISPLANVSVLAALGCVGGGVGFLTRRMGVAAPMSLLIAVPSGLVACVGMSKLLGALARGTREAAAFPTEGTVGSVLVRIAAGKTGEVAYLREGARATLPARSADGREIDAGTEVVVLEIEGGIARVAPSAELLLEKERRS